jgi:threonine dehydratase
MFEKIKAAKKALKDQANVTPIMTSRTLNGMTGASVYLKCENFQRTGAFKFRGAFNAISRLSDDQRKKGVLTYSSGNHAQAVALVGKLLNTETYIVMPKNAPEIKRQATRGYGANIIYYDPEKTAREAVAADLKNKHDYTLIPPYDHEDIVAGQGTVALEMFEELKTLDMLIAPCGGGGLLSGSAVTARELCPSCKVIGVEPELANDATLSFRTGRLHAVHNPPTIADGTRTPSLGKVTFPLVLKHVDDMVTVSEEEIKEAVRFLISRMKLVVEPSGALGIAAIASGKIRISGRTGIIISGGNIDAATLNIILSGRQ